MIRIAVLSDTHNMLPSRMLARWASADEIWHLGDVCEPGIADELQTLGPPLKVVRGNCDFVAQWPLTLDLRRAGLAIRLVHIPPLSAPPGVDLLLHGHTHRPRNEWLGNARVLYPGSVSQPRNGLPATFAWLELEEGAAPKWRLERV